MLIKINNKQKKIYEQKFCNFTGWGLSRAPSNEWDYEYPWKKGIH